MTDDGPTFTYPPKEPEPATCCHEQPKCSHYDEGYKVGRSAGYDEGFAVGHEAGGDDAMEEHVCLRAAVSNGGGSACVRCGRATNRWREALDQVEVPVCADCDDGAHFDGEAIRHAIREVLS